MSTGLSAVESWDLAALRGAVGSLTDVPDRLTGWRDQVDGLRDQLRHADLWSGPAADVAATALVELSSVAAEVRAALAVSAEALGSVVGQAGTAQEEAAAARSSAASGPVELSDAGVVAPVSSPVMAEEQLLAVADRERAAAWAESHARQALAAADGVLAAARASGDPLAPLTADVVVPGFDGVALAAAVVGPPLPVPAVDPVAAAAWWDGLTPLERRAVIQADPAAVGALDGLPAAARDQANRLLLAGALADVSAPGHAVAVTTADALAGLAADGRSAQLVTFDAGAGLVALSTGDLDTAESVAVLVPGINTTVTDDLPDVVADASRVTALAEAAAPGLAAAAVVWLGYRTPTTWTALSDGAARTGGPQLDRTLDGLAAARAQAVELGGPRPPRTTVVAHSYGTVVTAHAADAAGDLAADAVVLMGSPGVPVWSADGLEAPEVYGATARDDLVPETHVYGRVPGDLGFGDTQLPTVAGQGHSDYYDPAYPTLQAVAEVVAGTREHG
ncbi:Alpha/beta hydrolase [Klenkia soli]|uniref:Alpha/beta hydrolase n=1 Tax=Klenkia soli TaxID=1052260 RepID=A0A1H0NE77_9ACTN|nr:alpha/beta hydrolase [Klenkia soli]SDO91004.1 Alpha/beta hydrolase [Klenkia soli]